MSLSVNSRTSNKKPYGRRGTSPLLRLLRNTIIAVLVLIVLFVGAGLAYTWYMGRQEPPKKVEAVPAVTKPHVNTPSQPSPTAKVSASVQSFTSPVAPGENTSLTVRTNPKASCKITVEYNKVPSKDSGLVQKTADEFGMVTWTWTVDSTAPDGKWPAKVTCANAKNSAMVQADLMVKK